MRSRFHLVLLVWALVLFGCNTHRRGCISEVNRASLITWFEQNASHSFSDYEDPHWLECRRYLAALDRESLLALKPYAINHADSLLAQLVLVKCMSKAEALECIVSEYDHSSNLFLIPLIATVNESIPGLNADDFSYVFDWYFLFLERTIPLPLESALKEAEGKVKLNDHLTITSYYFGCGSHFEEVYSIQKSKSIPRIVGAIQLISWFLGDVIGVLDMMDMSNSEIKELFVDKANELKCLVEELPSEKSIRFGCINHINDAQVQKNNSSYLEILAAECDYYGKRLNDNDQLEISMQFQQALFNGMTFFKHWQLREYPELFQIAKDCSGLDIYSPDTFMMIRKLFLSSNIYRYKKLIPFYKTLYYMAFFGGHTRAQSMYEFHLEVLTTP